MALNAIEATPMSASSCIVDQRTRARLSPPEDMIGAGVLVTALAGAVTPVALAKPCA